MAILGGSVAFTMTCTGSGFLIADIVGQFVVGYDALIGFTLLLSIMIGLIPAVLLGRRISKTMLRPRQK